MDWIWMVLFYVVAALGTLALGFLLRWVDRKVTARVQWRVGPPWYQPAVDIIKLMGKENLMPATARGTGFLMAPVLALASTSVAAAILWHALIWPDPQGGWVGDLIVVIYLLAMPAIMTIAGASASGNPHASVGAAREMKLLLSYELPLVLAILVGVVHAEWTFSLGGLMTAQQSGWPTLFSLSGPLALIVAILCMQAKLGQVPFDLAEAECEIMSGVFVEYSGPSLAMFLMARMMMLAVLPLLLIAVFWSGLEVWSAWRWIYGVPLFLVKYVVLVALVTLIRNTNPRLRIDQALKFFWYVLTPASVIALVLAVIGL